MRQKPDNGSKAQHFECQYTRKKSQQVKYDKKCEGCIEMQIVDGTNHIEVKIRRLLKDEFHWFGKMEAIRDHDLGAIFFNRDHHRFRIK
jgi:hypothetical protein